MMRVVLLISIVFGLVWNIIAVRLMGGRFNEALPPAWMVAGAIAGATAGWFAIWSRRRREGEESIFYGLANYYVGMFAYWISLVVIQRVILCIQHGGWTDFDLRDHLAMITVFAIYGTVWYGILLIPLSFLCRFVMWKIYIRSA